MKNNIDIEIYNLILEELADIKTKIEEISIIELLMLKLIILYLRR